MTTGQKHIELLAEERHVIPLAHYHLARFRGVGGTALLVVQSLQYTDSVLEFLSEDNSRGTDTARGHRAPTDHPRRSPHFQPTGHIGGEPAEEVELQGREHG